MEIKSKKEISVLIICTNAIGDCYLSFSAVSALMDKYPNVKISIVINQESKILIPLLSFQEVFIIKSRSFYSTVRLLWEIRKINYNYTFSFFPGQINTIFLLLSKSRIKAGFKNVKKIVDWYGKSQTVYVNLNNEQQLEWKSQGNFLDRIKLVLEAAEIKDVQVAKYKPNTLSLKNNSLGLIVIHPISKMSKKSLSVVQLVSILEFLKSKFNFEFVVIGGNELDNIPDFRKVFTLNNVHLKVNESIFNLIQLIYNSRLFIGVDSFPVHLADSLNRNFVGIFGPTNPKSVLVNSNKSIYFSVDNMQDIDSNRLIQSLNEYLSNSNDNSNK
jgi:ADP-heptose:LPS heptosyltransferase